MATSPPSKTNQNEESTALVFADPPLESGEFEPAVPLHARNAIVALCKRLGTESLQTHRWRGESGANSSLNS